MLHPAHCYRFDVKVRLFYPEDCGLPPEDRWLRNQCLYADDKQDAEVQLKSVMVEIIGDLGSDLTDAPVEDLSILAVTWHERG
jgi:hypothetical protein